MKELFSGDVYVGLSGIDLEPDEFDLGEGITIRKTYGHLMAHFVMAFAPPVPGQPHPGPWKAATGRSGFESGVSAEIHIPSSHAEGLSIAETIAFMLRLRIDPAASLTVVSNYAFSDLPTVSDRNAKIVPVEVYPRYFPLSVADSLATPQRLDWIREYWKSTHSLIRESSEFALAVAAINTGQFVHNAALVLVSVWGALEALFSPSTTELKFRVSSLIAAFLEPPGESRLATQKQIGKLYDRRSSAAHGKPDHETKHILESFTLLRRVITEIIERRDVPTREDLEKRLFGAGIFIANN